MDLESELGALSVLDSWEEEEKGSAASTEVERPYSPAAPWPFGDYNVAEVAVVVPSPPPSPSRTPPGSPRRFRGPTSSFARFRSPRSPDPTAFDCDSHGPSSWPSAPPIGRVEPLQQQPLSVDTAYGLRPCFWDLLARGNSIDGVLFLSTWRLIVAEFLQLPSADTDEEREVKNLLALRLLSGYINASRAEAARRVEHIQQLRQMEQRRRDNFPF